MSDYDKGIAAAIDLVSRYADKPMSRLRLAASLGNGSQMQADEELRGFTRGQLLARIIRQQLQGESV